MKTKSSQQKTSQRRKTPVQRAASAGPGGMAVAAPQNRTGLPDALKSGIESLSGLSLDDVRVHYNSSKPANLQALAYAQGTDIHVGPGQERHLAHEAWHVIQQKQGRVQPTTQMKGGIPVNSDRGLEHEADVMGTKALGNTLQRKNRTEEDKPLQGKFESVQRRASTESQSPSVDVIQMERFVDHANSRVHLHLDIGNQDHLKIDGVRYNLMGPGGYDADRVAAARRALRRAPYVPDKVACERELRGLA